MVRNDDIRLAKHMMHFNSEVKPLYSTVFVHIHVIERNIVMLLSQFPPSHVHVYLRYIRPFIIFCETIFFHLNNLHLNNLYIYIYDQNVCTLLARLFSYSELQLAWSNYSTAKHDLNPRPMCLGRSMQSLDRRDVRQCMSS